jgi:hypothetical protein
MTELTLELDYQRISLEYSDGLVPIYLYSFKFIVR